MAPGTIHSKVQARSRGLMHIPGGDEGGREGGMEAAGQAMADVENLTWHG